jgi:hypothetical protein
MSYPKVTFQVRLRSADGLDAVAHRVSAVLGCTFAPTSGDEFNAPTMAAATLGLDVLLVGEAVDDPDTEVTYILRGLVRPDVEAALDVDAPTISISQYVLGVLRVLDDEGWYIAERAELLAEAGLPPSEESQD